MENFKFAMLAIPVGMAVFYLVVFQFLGRRGRTFGEDILHSAFGIPLVIRKKYRWNELLTVREQYPYVGTREAYIEGRAETHLLFGLIVVYTERYRLEIETNTIINVMIMGSALNGAELNKHFPSYLAYNSGLLGKGGAMPEREFYVSGAGLSK